MGKNLKGKELGAGISRRKDGRYSARFVTSSGKRIEKYFPMLQDARKWLAEAKLNDENGSVGVSVGMTVDAWFEFWIVNIKDKTVRYNTARNYRERYRQNIKKHIGKMLMIHGVQIFDRGVARGTAEDQARISGDSAYEGKPGDAS